MKQVTLDDLLAAAIEQEIQSQEVYRRAHEQVSDVEAKAFLAELVAEEERHQRLLESVREMEIYDGSVAVPEAADLDAASASHGAKVADLGPAATAESVLETALGREHRARTTFARMAKAACHPELRTLFEKLAEEEDSHHRRIERYYRTSRGETVEEM